MVFHDKVIQFDGFYLKEGINDIEALQKALDGFAKKNGVSSVVMSWILEGEVENGFFRYNPESFYGTFPYTGKVAQFVSEVIALGDRTLMEFFDTEGGYSGYAIESDKCHPLHAKEYVTTPDRQEYLANLWIQGQEQDAVHAYGLLLYADRPPIVAGDFGVYPSEQINHALLDKFAMTISDLIMESEKPSLAVLSVPAKGREIHQAVTLSPEEASYVYQRAEQVRQEKNTTMAREGAEMREKGRVMAKSIGLNGLEM